jgi:hypothetical protein
MSRVRVVGLMQSIANVIVAYDDVKRVELIVMIEEFETVGFKSSSETQEYLVTPL